MASDGYTSMSDGYGTRSDAYGARSGGYGLRPSLRNPDEYRSDRFKGRSRWDMRDSKDNYEGHFRFSDKDKDSRFSGHGYALGRHNDNDYYEYRRYISY